MGITWEFDLKYTKLTHGVKYRVTCSFLWNLLDYFKKVVREETWFKQSRICQIFSHSSWKAVPFLVENRGVNGGSWDDLGLKCG